MASRLAIPPIGNDDRLPHDAAVWRRQVPSLPFVMGLDVSADYGEGEIEQAKGEDIAWPRVKRWRFGWAPK